MKVLALALLLSACADSTDPGDIGFVQTGACGKCLRLWHTEERLVVDGDSVLRIDCRVYPDERVCCPSIDYGCPEAFSAYKWTVCGDARTLGPREVCYDSNAFVWDTAQLGATCVSEREGCEWLEGQ